KVGMGRVVVWTSSLDDSWNDLVLKPVYLPLVQRLVRYLAQYEEPASWSTVGQVVDLSPRLKNRAERVVVMRCHKRITQAAGSPGGSPARPKPPSPTGCPVAKDACIVAIRT